MLHHYAYNHQSITSRFKHLVKIDDANTSPPSHLVMTMPVVRGPQVKAIGRKGFEKHQVFFATKKDPKRDHHGQKCGIIMDKNPRIMDNHGLLWKILEDFLDMAANPLIFSGKKMWGPRPRLLLPAPH